MRWESCHKRGIRKNLNNPKEGRGFSEICWMMKIAKVQSIKRAEETVWGGRI